MQLQVFVVIIHKNNYYLRRQTINILDIQFNYQFIICFIGFMVQNKIKNISKYSEIIIEQIKVEKNNQNQKNKIKRKITKSKENQIQFKKRKKINIKKNKNKNKNRRINKNKLNKKKNKILNKKNKVQN